MKFMIQEPHLVVIQYYMLDPLIMTYLDSIDNLLRHANYYTLLTH